MGDQEGDITPTGTKPDNKEPQDAQPKSFEVQPTSGEVQPKSGEAQPKSQEVQVPPDAVPEIPPPPKQPSENPSTASSVYGGSATPTNTDTTSCSCRECECDCDCDQGVSGGQDLCGYCAKYCR